jgi:hypothetical protein
MKRRDTDLFCFMGVGVAKQRWIERSALDAKEMAKPQIFNIVRRSARSTL